MSMRPVRAALVAVAILGAALTGCSGGGAGSTTNPSQNQTGTSSTVPTSQPSRDDFKTALKFTQLVHDGEYGKADDLVAPSSAAERYVTHQRKYAEAQEGATYGIELPGHEVWRRRTGSIKIERDPEPIPQEPGGVPQMGKPVKYTWSAFKFDPMGKITSWDTGQGPLERTLMSKPATGKAYGLKAELISANWSNDGDLDSVIQMSATRKTAWYGASYSPKKGFRRELYSYSEMTSLEKGDRVLITMTFRKASIPGVLRITAEAPDLNEATIKLPIR